MITVKSRGFNGQIAVRASAKTFILLMLCGQSLLSPAAFSQSEDTLYDVFPLQPGLRYTYAYFDEATTSDELTSSGRSDSGMVEYIVLDSVSVSDSTILWNVQTIHHVWRREGNCCVPPSDTAFWIDDSLTIPLYETKFGRHELRCSDYVWRFPLMHDSAFYRILFEPIYRFADTLALVADWQLHPGADTLWFSTASGFYRRRYQLDGWRGYLHTTHDLKVQATHDPVLHVPGPAGDPVRFVLNQNYPNPFNPGTIIRYALPHRSNVTLIIFNTLGQQVAQLVNGEGDAGYHEVKFDGSALASGVYFYRLQAGDLIQTRRLIVLH